MISECEKTDNLESYTITYLKDLDERVRVYVICFDVYFLQGLVGLDGAGQVTGGEVSHRGVGHGDLGQNLVVPHGLEQLEELVFREGDVVQVDLLKTGIVGL